MAYIGVPLALLGGMGSDSIDKNPDENLAHNTAETLF